MKSSIFRPIQLVLLGAITLILLALLATSWLTWREQARLSRARSLLATTLAFHEQHGRVQRSIIAIVTGEVANARTERILEQIDELTELAAPDDARTRDLLETLRRELASALPAAAERDDQIMQLLHEIALSEARFEAGLIGELQRESGVQLRYELAAPLVLLTVAVIAFPITRRRVMKPLESFGRQMSGLAEGDFTPTPDDEISDHTLPLHRNFIKLALRLQELEREQRERAESLEEEVRSATAALLEQQQSLARAERLAVAGELAASVAHEIRNPLAGIQMSLANLRHELSDPALAERVDLVTAEVERLARLVGEIVDAARHDPEPPAVIDVADVVDDLLALTRYQLPPGIRVAPSIDPALRARVPKERLRQALLNLILNATAAIGDREGVIEVNVAAEGDDLRIEVADDGPGFPEDLIQGGVRPFHSTRSRGAGLGLAMVRRFARDAEGSVALENRAPGGERPGARVTLLLPSAVAHG
jgi:nitrogen fixation/metabolism regulation signal transduction histidine kinase